LPNLNNQLMTYQSSIYLHPEGRDFLERCYNMIMEEMSERSPEIRSETLELIRNPEQVFDSDLGKARREAERVEGDILRMEGLHKSSRGVEIHIETPTSKTETTTDYPPIRVVWANPNEESGTMLELVPIPAGTGGEGAILGYKGYYGNAKRTEKSFTFKNGQKVGLEALFKAPPSTNFVVHPTVGRWAVGEDIFTPIGSTDLYMGLGMLLIGEEWMYIGFHEAGHLPDRAGENKAWTRGKVNHASYYHGKRELTRQMSRGKSQGLFGVLKKPDRWENTNTVGKIERLGITSHAMGGNAKLPEQWAGMAEESLDDLRRVIINAQFAYDNFFSKF